jgi:hypothetical protein
MSDVAAAGPGSGDGVGCSLQADARKKATRSILKFVIARSGNQ